MHSIIIPHRDYNRYLPHCIWSIERSAKVCGVEDYEILVVDQCSRVRPQVVAPCVILLTMPHGAYFNKPWMQNAGIEKAEGDVLTFLDADAIVGPKWMECVERLDRVGPMALTKLCYRLRYLPREAIDDLEEAASREDLVNGWFSQYDSFPIGIECYRFPDKHIGDCPEGFVEKAVEDGAVFGNSPFSILRTTLGDLRFNEDFQGRGFEDLWMNREIARKFGWDGKTGEPGDYRAGIVTDPEHAIFHIRNDPPQTETQKELWGPGKQNVANFKRYYSS